MILFLPNLLILEKLYLLFTMVWQLATFLFLKLRDSIPWHLLFLADHSSPIYFLVLFYFIQMAVQIETFFKESFFKQIYWGIIDLQCVLVSGVEQSESVTHTHLHSFLLIGSILI